MISVGIHNNNKHKRGTSCLSKYLYFVYKQCLHLLLQTSVRGRRLQTAVTYRLEPIPIERQVGLNKCVPIYIGHSDKNASYPKGYVYHIFTVHELRFRISWYKNKAMTFLWTSDNVPVFHPVDYNIIAHGTD